MIHEYYSITELTREFGITTRTLRFYEDEGLIKPTRRGRTRLYTHVDRQMLRRILRARKVGFSVEEVGKLLAIYRPLPEHLGELGGMLNEIDRTRQELRQKRRDLEELLEELDEAEELCVERLAELGVKT